MMPEVGGGRRPVFRGYQEKHNKQPYGCYADLSLNSFCIDKCFWRIILPFRYGEEDAFTNGDFPIKHKCFL